MPEMTTPQGNIPAASVDTLKLEKFRGIDLTSGAVNVDRSRSPDAVNIMPDEDGFPKKRPGWKVTARYGAKIWAAHRYVGADGAEQLLVHAGTKLYLGETEIYGGMAEAHSVSAQLAGKLWLLDGQSYLYYDGETCAPVAEIATVPLITIAKAPNGETGATSYQAVNLLTGKRTDSYLGTTAAKKYVLSFNNLSDGEVVAKKLAEQEDGVYDWTEIDPAEYTVDRAAGAVTFTTAPGQSPVEGEDNVRITYEVAENGAERINRCRMMILYGVNGALDRVFVAGNPGEVNVDYWSEFEDPAYMGDVFYGMVGQDASPIVGYNVLGNRLVTLKRGEENGRNIFVRGGALDDEGFAAFELVGVMQGEGAVSERCFATLASEPLFLTGQGVQALTPSDITGERYAQARSYYIKSGLNSEKNLGNACAISWGRFYVLAVNDRMYLLDGEQKNYESREPYSTYQFEGYLWKNTPATCLFVHEGALCFGTEDGRVCAFKNSGRVSDYTDEDGNALTPIECWWTTPLMDLGVIGRLKTVTGAWLMAQPYTKSSGSIYYATDKEQERLIREYFVDIFGWDDVDFARWTFNLMDRPMISAAARKAKKVKLFQMKVANTAAGEPFGIYAIQIDYRVGGRVRR